MSDENLNLPLTRAQLDTRVCPCGNCNDRYLYLKGKCHPNAGVEACYNKQNGELTLRCKKCNAPVVKVKVAADLITV